MKVILTRDIARLGKKSEIRDVPSGHALNFLIPQKLAVIATPEQVKKVEETMRKRTAQSDALMDSFASACATLKNRIVHMQVEANEQGHLFKGLHVHDIVAQVEKETQIVLAPNTVVLPHPIKSVGTHTVSLEQGTMHGTCTLEITKK